MYRRYLVLIAAVFLLMQGCSANTDSSGSTATGAVSVSVTDAPAFGVECCPLIYTRSLRAMLAPASGFSRAPRARA